MKLAKAYEPNQYEPNIYAMWEKSGAFNPSGKGEPFSIVMPPPNANGNLHMGHALTTCLQDILSRYYRMRGYDVAYIPGADHAGFETWVVYERVLEEKGIEIKVIGDAKKCGRIGNAIDDGFALGASV